MENNGNTEYGMHTLMDTTTGNNSSVFGKLPTPKTVKELNENIIKTQDELIEILKSQLQNSNDIIEEQKKLMNMHEEVIKKQSTLLNNFKKIVYEQ